ncbi:hypothetical protein predicted by Glimmer/Critica [Sorangium cellulosum So ce56]|uniref:DUF2914 domain-containing protein n=1 Tax=Sorangium cellulosum (strain So ce56) TaxID=448385 RepID=A9F2L4_SORC5|nr:DUF2914 domain-containing protein [Sorangium cellulosum]CAN94498.1 hypothetical protein predicted by Glimmer/Critica [Sorangium cellulosum So ce56]
MVLALAAAALGGAGLGCSDPSEAIARISREELPALSRAAEGRPGGGSEGQASAAAGLARSDAAVPLRAAVSGAAADEGRSDADRLDAADVSPARGPGRERRRRSGSAEARTAAGAAQGGVGEGAARAPELQVIRLVVSKGIAGREPIEPASSFASAEIDRLYAFVELSNKDQATSEISVAFTPPDGGAPLRIPLAVGAQRRFRTWAATRKARAAGLWSVTVSDAAGKELARASFTITK